MHEAYPSHCATCFSQPLFKFSFQKELNVSHLKGFLLNGHTKRFRSQTQRIKTNTVKTNNWYQKCFVQMITLRVCSETQKLPNWSHDRFSFTDSKVWTIWTAQLKLNKQYGRKVLLRRFHLIAIAQDFSLSVPFGYNNDGGERGKYY